MCDDNVGIQLDPVYLAGFLARSKAREKVALRRLEEHAGLAPDGYLAWSGGKDSTVALHLALQVTPNIPVVWFHSGLEFPETEEYVHQLRKVWGFQLRVIRAQPDALTVLGSCDTWSHGTPVLGSVWSLHEVLVAAPARRAHLVFGMGEVSGMRASESVSRRRVFARAVEGMYERGDGTRVCAPLWDWSSEDVYSYMHRHCIPVNPVYERLRELGAPPEWLRSGLVFDGNGLSLGRATWVRLGWPDLWQQIVKALPRAAEWR